MVGRGGASTDFSAASTKTVSQRAVFRLRETIWVPACAGKTEKGNKAPFGASRHFPQRGKIGAL